MKSRFPAVLVALCLVVVAFAATASAASANQSKGTITSFSYHSASKSGVLTLLNKGDKVKFRVHNNSKNSACGVSFGQSGDSIPCRTLGKAKYHGRIADVTWKKQGGRRVTSLVSVRMY
jgi:hypothetical protein